MHGSGLGAASTQRVSMPDLCYNMHLRICDRNTVSDTVHTVLIKMWHSFRSCKRAARAARGARSAPEGRRGAPRSGAGCRAAAQSAAAGG